MSINSKKKSALVVIVGAYSLLLGASQADPAQALITRRKQQKSVYCTALQCWSKTPCPLNHTTYETSQDAQVVLHDVQRLLSKQVLYLIGEYARQEYTHRIERHLTHQGCNPGDKLPRPPHSSVSDLLRGKSCLKENCFEIWKIGKKPERWDGFIDETLDTPPDSKVASVFLTESVKKLFTIREQREERRRINWRNICKQRGYKLEENSEPIYGNDVVWFYKPSCDKRISISFSGGVEANFDYDVMHLMPDETSNNVLQQSGFMENDLSIFPRPSNASFDRSNECKEERNNAFHRALSPAIVADHKRMRQRQLRNALLVGTALGLGLSAKTKSMTQ